MRKSTLHRIKILYWVLTAMLVLVLVTQLSGFVSGFISGLSSAPQQYEHMAKGRNMVVSTLDVKSYHEDFINVEDRDLLYLAPDSSIVVESLPAAECLVISRDNDVESSMEWTSVCSMIFMFLLPVLYVAIVVFLFKVLSDIKSSLKKNALFSRKVIKYTRWVGVLLILCTVVSNVFMHLQDVHTLSVLELCGVEIAERYMANPLLESMLGVVTGLLVLFFAEVMTIGYDMSEEQKLTI